MTDILIVDDEPFELRRTADVTRLAGFTVLTAASGAEAMAQLREHRDIAAVLLDLVMPDLDGMGVMDAMLRENLSTPVIVLTGGGGSDGVTAALRRGAVDFVPKPPSPERLLAALASAARLGRLEDLLRAERGRRVGLTTPSDLVAASPEMGRVMSLAGKAARTPLPVLVEGESGTGKDTVARLLHGLSERSGRSFHRFDCATPISAPALEAALFGQRGPRPVSGAFTAAHGGTLYLDEVGELPEETQAKLLRVIQEGALSPVGSSRPEPVHVRIIASSRTALLDRVTAGQFREDLFYRLAVMPIHLPPLRNRPADLAPLLARTLAAAAAETGRRVASISEEATEMLQSYKWPGNVRQLENAVFRAVSLCESSQIERRDFPGILAELSGPPAALRLFQSGPAILAAGSALPESAVVRPRPPSLPEPKADRFLDGTGQLLPLEAVERALISFAIERCRGRMSQVARLLKIGRSTLYRKLRDYGLEADVDRDAA